MAKKIASKLERQMRIKRGRAAEKRYAKEEKYGDRFKGTRTEQIAKDPYYLRKAKKKTAEEQKAYDEKHRKISEMKTVKNFKRPSKRKKK